MFYIHYIGQGTSKTCRDVKTSITMSSAVFHSLTNMFTKAQPWLSGKEVVPLPWAQSTGSILAPQSVRQSVLDRKLLLVIKLTIKLLPCMAAAIISVWIDSLRTIYHAKLLGIKIAIAWQLKCHLLHNIILIRLNRKNLMLFTVIKHSSTDEWFGSKRLWAYLE